LMFDVDAYVCVCVCVHCASLSILSCNHKRCQWFHLIMFCSTIGGHFHFYAFVPKSDCAVYFGSGCILFHPMMFYCLCLKFVLIIYNLAICVRFGGTRDWILLLNSTKYIFMACQAQVVHYTASPTNDLSNYTSHYVITL
jgi:hypothetical protein